MYKLWKPQKKLVKNIRQSSEQYNRILVGSPTGSGKSVIMSHMIKKDLSQDYRVLVLAPYRKLVFQLEQTFAIHEPHVIMGNIDRGNKISGLVLSSAQTMHSRLLSNSKYFEGFDIIYIDEAHIGCDFPPNKTSMFGELYNKYWQSAKWFGFSATPITAQGFRLNGWDTTIYRTQTKELIKKGVLAKFRYFAPVDLDLSSMRTRMGEYVNEDIEEVTLNASAVSSVKKVWKEKAKNKLKSLIFASSITHAELLCKAIKGSYVIHSNMKESEGAKILEAYRISKYGTLINVGMLTTGFDDPTVEMLIIARPTKSVRLYMQIVGRVLRKYGDKVAQIYDMCSCHKNCGLPDDLRDFNKVKLASVKKEILEDEHTMACDICGEVSNVSDFLIKRKTKKTFIKATWYCPKCGEVCKETRKDLSIVEEFEELNVQKEIPKLSFQQRKKIVYELVEEFTRAKPSWSHFIVQVINASGRTKLLEQEIAKGNKPYTLWKNIMKIYETANEEVKNEK